LRACFAALGAEGEIWRRVGQGKFWGRRPVHLSIRETRLVEGATPPEIKKVCLLLETTRRRCCSKQSEVFCATSPFEGSAPLSRSNGPSLWSSVLHFRSQPYCSAKFRDFRGADREVFERPAQLKQHKTVFSCHRVFMGAIGVVFIMHEPNPRFVTYGLYGAALGWE